MILPLCVKGWGGSEWNETDQKKKKRKKSKFSGH